MENITLGFAMCGSFCTFDPVLTALEALKAQYPDIIPIPVPGQRLDRYPFRDGGALPQPSGIDLRP